MAEALIALVRANAVASLVMLLVLVLRAPARRAFGAETAYRLWMGPALAGGASLLPTPVGLGDPAAAILSPVAVQALAGVWAAGAGALAMLMGVAQLRFAARARRGLEGAAVIGVLAPRIVMPADAAGYTPTERRLMRAHERMHIDRRDPQARAWMAIARCLGWWNPLVHLGLALASLDQELACDAAVLRQMPWTRPHYARTLLRAQAPSAALPLGARWAGTSRHPLETRLANLAGYRRGESAVGDILLTLLLVALAVVGWVAQPTSGPARSLVEQRVQAAAADNQATMSVLLVAARSRAAR